MTSKACSVLVRLQFVQLPGPILAALTLSSSGSRDKTLCRAPRDSDLDGLT